MLQELHHPNIIGLLDVYGHKSNISLVFDFMHTDLEAIIQDVGIVLSTAHIKAYLLMTFKGLEYLHSHWVLHRDLKPNNLLINTAGILKISDFGLAKSFGSPNRMYTHQVVTRWYRSPELLFGARLYGTGVDIWAVGCIMAELLLRVPFLQGDTDLGQLSEIFKVFGTPTEQSWPGVSALPDYISFKEMPAMSLKAIFSAASDDTLHLLENCLKLNPTARFTATQALKSPYFIRKPLPCPSHLLPKPCKQEKETLADSKKLPLGIVAKKLEYE